MDRQRKRQALSQYSRNSKSAKLRSPVDGATTHRHIDGQRDTTTQYQQKQSEKRTIPPLAPVAISAGDATEVEDETDPSLAEKDTQVHCHTLIVGTFMLREKQTRAAINEFLAIEERLQLLLLERYANPLANEVCICGHGFRVVRCHWDGCFQYPTSCEGCFVKAHRTNPLHWALVWDASKEVWIKKDFSEVIKGTFIQLGHVGEDEPCPGGKGPIDFKITHTNGVHSTKVQFCSCPSSITHEVDQLIRSDLFPATAKEPRSAFTLAILRHFRMHNLQSKCGAFDFIMSIRRLTNNTFTHGGVPVSIQNLSV